MAVKKTDKNRIGAGKAGPGRPKGLPNKTTAAVKDMLREALDECGGVVYLVEKAKEHPVAFLGLIGKLIPTEVKGDVDSTVTIKVITGV